jgi:hypothetical protein
VNDLFGIYLPILLPSEECCREPIVLAYNQSHFCPFQTRHVGSGPEVVEQKLPLYPTIDDTYDQKLLPTRFLDNDVTKQDSTELLSKYLNITELPYSFDAGSPPLKIQCAELGTKGLKRKDDFLFLYYDYCKDFFGIQLPNALAEDQRRAEEQRRQDDYNYQQTTYGTGTRRHFNTVSLPRLDPLPRRTATNNETGQRQEQELPTTDSVSMEAYTPRTDGIFVSHQQVQLRQAPTLSGSTATTPRATQSDFLFIEETKPRTRTSDAENIGYTYLQEKDTNRPPTNPPPTEYRDGQGNIHTYL